MQQKINHADTIKCCSSNDQKLKSRFQNSEAIKIECKKCLGLCEEIAEKSGGAKYVHNDG